MYQYSQLGHTSERSGGTSLAFTSERMRHKVSPVALELQSLCLRAGRTFFFLQWFELLTAVFLLTHLSVRSLCKWVSIHQPLSFGSLYRSDCPLTIVHLAVVPQKIKLPEITDAGIRENLTQNTRRVLDMK